MQVRTEETYSKLCAQPGTITILPSEVPDRPRCDLHHWSVIFQEGHQSVRCPKSDLLGYSPEHALVEGQPKHRTTVLESAVAEGWT